MQYAMRYVLGIPDVANIKADKGNVVHKALELLARWKVAVQEGQKSFSEQETGREWSVADFTTEDAFQAAWHYQTTKQSHHPWCRADADDCRQWMNNALKFANGLYDPRNRHVIWPEKYFDFEVEAPWARYDYLLPDGSRLAGRLALKGTLDLTTWSLESADDIELIDWKTGARKDWATGQEKDYDKLCKDPQLRLYYYALTKLMPQVESVFVTIFWLRDGGPFMLPFTRDDIPEIEEMLRKRFEQVRNTDVPSRIRHTDRGWKCTRFCHYGKTAFPGDDRPMCDRVYEEMTTLGMERVLRDRGNLETISHYGEGGGRTHKEP
jgi:hypothetical protein